MKSNVSIATDQAYVCYARISSEEQKKQGYSIEAQLKLIREYASCNSYSISKEYVDVETAGKSGRKNFSLMVKSIEEIKSTGMKVAILVEKTDRLYRNIKDWVLLDDLDVEVHFVKEGSVLSNSSKSSDKFMHGIRVLMAKNFLDNLREEVNKGMDEKAEQGHYPSRAPLGYCNVRTNGKSFIEPDSNAPLITGLFRKYSTGDYSLESLHDEMVKEYPIRSCFGKVISRSAMGNLLKNPVYHGVFRWRGKQYIGKHQPLVSPELFDMVQDKLQEKSQQKKKSTKKQWLYQGMIECEMCSSALTMEIKKKKYIYYHCTNSKRNCSKVYIREERIEEQIIEHLSQISPSRELTELVAQTLRESKQDLDQYQLSRRQELEHEYQEVQRKLSVLYEDRLSGRITTDFYDKTKDNLVLTQREIEQRMLNLTKAGHQYLDEGVKIIELAESAVNTYKTADLSTKRRFLKIVLSNLLFRENQIEPIWRKPFDLLPLMIDEHQKERGVSVTENAPCPIEYTRKDSNPQPSDP